MVQRTCSLGEEWVRDAWWCPCGFNIWLSSFVGVSEVGRSSPGSKLGSFCSSSVVGEAWKGRSWWEAASPASWRSQRRSCCSYRCSGKCRRGCVVFKYWCVTSRQRFRSVHWCSSCFIKIPGSFVTTFYRKGDTPRLVLEELFSSSATKQMCVCVYTYIYLKLQLLQ